MDNTGFLHQVITDEGFVAANALAKVLHITQNDLADVTGLSRDSVSKSSRCKTKSTQARLRDTVEIINRVSAGRANSSASLRPMSIQSINHLRHD
ncbi:MAG: hypothetical protein NTY50_00015 [Methylobacter sp.]|nr:hypothetical protein [Methylobacter sp.]